MAGSRDLKNEKRALERQRRDYEKRREDVERLLSSVQGSFDGEIADVNTAMEKLAGQQEEGFLNFAPVGAVSARIREEKEKSVYSDSEMSGVQDWLREDIRDTNSRIDGLNDSIANLEIRIREAEAAEEEERRRAREAEAERLRNMWAALTGNNS